MSKGIKNPATGSETPNLTFQYLSPAVDKLKNEIRHFKLYYNENPNARNTHPIFGELGAEQWQKFHFKHCFHHSSQFGLITDSTSKDH